MKTRRLMTMAMICLATMFLFAGMAAAKDEAVKYDPYYTKEQIAEMGIDNLDAPDLTPMIKKDVLDAKDIAINSRKIWLKEMALYGIGISAANFKKKWIDEEG